MKPMLAIDTFFKVGGILVTLCFILTIMGTPAHAQRAPGSIGLGGQIGDPSGITLKVYNPRSVSYDFLAAWDLDDFFFFNAHGIFESHIGNTQTVHVFYGPGGFVGFRERPVDEDDDTVAGISGRVGLSFLIERFEIYGQVTPRLAVVPETDGDVGGGVGFRFYF